MADVPFHQRREAALGLVLLSGVAIFCTSFPLQAAAWELRMLFYARFEWTESDLPALTRWFVDVFGYRPDCYLMAVVWWFFWPIAGSFGYCHFKYSKPVEFSSAFRYAFMYCWLIFVCFVCVVLMICSMPFAILLNELGHEPPAITAAIAPISWSLPIGAAGVAFGAWLRNRGSKSA